MKKKYSDLAFAFHSGQPARELLEAAIIIQDRLKLIDKDDAFRAFDAAIAHCRPLVPPRISDLKAGDRLMADDGFTCIAAGRVVTVAIAANDERVIPCKHGFHSLDGQRVDFYGEAPVYAYGDELVGLVRAPADPIPEGVCQNDI